MAVILVSRGSMSGGQVVAECLSREGGLLCISREDLVETVNHYGSLAAQLTEQVSKASRDYEKFAKLRRPYRIFMKKALLQYAQEGNLAYFGYSGHLLLDKIRHLVRVRLTAPMDLRVRLTMNRLECSEEEARDYIRTADDERTRWARFMYGADIRDPAQYDICLSMERFTPASACRLVQEMVLHDEFVATPESVRQLENSKVANDVLAALVRHPETFSLDVAARFDAPTVHLEGPWLEPELLRRVERIARTVQQVQEVVYEPGYAPSFLLS
jgi:cytidylate kinase